MNTIDKIITQRQIPDALTTKRGKKIESVKDFEKHREELKYALQEYVYGYIPKKPEHMNVELISEDNKFCAGKAPLKTLKFTVTINGEQCSFIVKSVVPKSEEKLPAFIHINFRSDVPDKYQPSEEIADNGFAVFSFCYADVTKDDKNFKDNLAKLLSPARRTQTSPGKIAMWAWAAMRVMDYVQTLDSVDLDNVAVVGHSRLGKTALLTAAFDSRFKYAISNDSGCTGAAITRGKRGEDIGAITARFGYWFCKRYEKYAQNENTLPLDQNFLTTLIAPRHLVIGSAEEDIWADPESEFLSAYMASEAYKLYGVPGLIHCNDIPTAKSILDEGNVCYHVRHGVHYFGREDWIVYMNYIKKHLK